jgi:hypothetical protein
MVPDKCDCLKVPYSMNGYMERTVETAYPLKAKSSEIALLSKAPRFPKRHCFFEGPQAPPVCPDEYGAFGGMILTGEKYWRKACLSATWSTTNLTWTDLTSNP